MPSQEMKMALHTNGSDLGTCKTSKTEYSVCAYQPFLRRFYAQSCSSEFSVLRSTGQKHKF